MTYAVLLAPSARRSVKKIPPRDRERILLALAILRDNPRPPGAVKLSGEENAWRVRVGVYRILYRIRDDILEVMVVKVGHRREVYRRLEDIS
jgi:mRNA interferase RelE/StbE